MPNAVADAFRCIVAMSNAVADAFRCIVAVSDAIADAFRVIVSSASYRVAVSDSCNDVGCASSHWLCHGESDSQSFLRATEYGIGQVVSGKVHPE
ncbi:hypothetical protein EBZ80_25455 [bacterium]|nr:hypothetical protein [bacterium]